MTDTENQPPADMETKSTIGSGLANPGQPGYQIEGQPVQEHGPEGLQVGYTNSPGRDGDDGASSIFTERDKADSSGAKQGARKSTATKTSTTKGGSGS